MKTTDTILIILAKCRATTSVLASELHQPQPVIDAFCKDAAEAGHITSTAIGGKIDCWEITPDGLNHLQAVLDAKKEAPLSKA